MDTGEFLQSCELAVERVTREKCTHKENCTFLGATVLGVKEVNPKKYLNTTIETLGVFSCYDNCPLTKDNHISILREAIRQVYEELGLEGDTIDDLAF